ncbi:MAG: permease [Pseudomonadota bacterium]
MVWIFDPQNVSFVVQNALISLQSTAVFIAISVILIGYLKASDAQYLITTIFKGHEVKMIILAALIGGLAPFCSCEVIPFIAGLLSLGTPLSVVMAFWLSSPLIDPPALFITAGVLGWDFAVYKAIGAVTLGLFGGGFVWALCRTGLFKNPLRENTKIGCNQCALAPKENVEWRIWRDRQRILVFKGELFSNGLFLLKWLALAYFIQAILILYISEAWISDLLGEKGVLSTIIAALVGMPAYLNGYVAPAFVGALISQGMGKGAAMAFLISGAVSSIPAMVAVYSLVKKQVFATYLLLGFLGAVLLGLLFELVV